MNGTEDLVQYDGAGRVVFTSRRPVRHHSYEDGTRPYQHVHKASYGHEETGLVSVVVDHSHTAGHTPHAHADLWDNLVCQFIDEETPERRAEKVPAAAQAAALVRDVQAKLKEEEELARAAALVRTTRESL